tara:strand:- start:91 stop:243 length:153 start_codon:yes stop_codon:yes gene_type:complete
MQVFDHTRVEWIDEKKGTRLSHEKISLLRVEETSTRKVFLIEFDDAVKVR